MKVSNGGDQIGSLDRRIRVAAVDELRQTWGGRMPTWEEFKAARTEGRVRTNKVLALDAIWWHGMPKMEQVLFGIVTPWTAFLIVPAAIAAYFLSGASGWWILGSGFAAWYLYKVSQVGACQGIEIGAKQSREIYENLVNNGAFLFGPLKHSKNHGET